MVRTDKLEQTAVNDSRTELASDTGLTHGSSRTVLEQTRRDLIVMREVHGAETDSGHGFSNLVELVQVLPGYVRPSWLSSDIQSVPWLIEKQNERLQRLLKAG